MRGKITEVNKFTTL